MTQESSARVEKRNVFLTVDACFQVGVWLNLALTIFKFLAGIFGGSRAMIVDAIHSTSDVISTVIVWLAYKSSKRPADENHPYGHEGIESLAAVFVGLILIITGAYMIYSSSLVIAHETYRQPTRLALFAALVSILLKELLYHYTIWISKRENSPALHSSAWDHRSDAFSSVAAFLGIIGARTGRFFLDPAAGILIAVLIGQMGYKIMRENLGVLIDEPPKPELFGRLKGIIDGVDGVEGIGDFKMRRRGSMYYIDLTIFVGDCLTVAEGHLIAERVERNLLESGNRVFSAMVHVEPVKAWDTKKERDES